MDDEKTHQRNESVYSMDSFVADFPSREGDKSNSPSPEKKNRPQNYMSPLSSAATTPVSAGHQPPHQQQPPQPQQHRTTPSFQDTIDSMPGFNSSDHTPVPRVAPNPFFSPSYYDDSSEVSDGSFIVHDTPATPVVPKQQQQRHQQQQQQLPFSSAQKQQQQQQARDNRDRFPSFDDSVGSSGSIQYVPKQTSRPSKPTPPAPVVTAPLTAEQIQRLPYHERRKLLAQRRQQQQQQQQPNTAPLEAPGPSQGYAPLPASDNINMGRLGGGMPQPMALQQQQHHMPRMDRNAAGPPLQQQQQQQPQHAQQMFNPYVMAPPEMMYYPNSPMMQHQQHPLHPGQSPYGRPPYQGIPPPPVGPPASSGYGNYPMSSQGMPQGYYPMPPGSGYPIPSPPPPMQFQPPQQQQQYQQQHRASPLQSRGKEHLQTTGLPRGYTGRPIEPSTIIGRTRSSSLDSSDGNEGKVRKGSSGSSNAPPPPPPPPVGTHMRTDSSGSLSSFGSQERPSSNHKDDEKEKKSQQDKSFLARLNPWAPKVPNVDDYHRKNQAFLKKASQERLRTPSPSPKQEIRRKPLGSMDRPPPSRGTHKRLPSIDNDDWEEDEDGGKKMVLKADARPETQRSRTYSSGEDSGYAEDRGRSESRIPPRFKHKGDTEPDERTRLLPPPGISSNEQYDKLYIDQNISSRHRPGENMVATVRADNTSSGQQFDFDYENAKKLRKKKKGKSRSRRSRHDQPEDVSDASYSSSSASSQEYQRWMKKRSRLLEKERNKLMRKWREEAKAEEEAKRAEQEKNRWYNRLNYYLHSEFGDLFVKVFKFLTWAEAFIANIPLTINAIALAIANLGVVWFKFAEENMQSCEPVHYHSSQCTFPEFPGCFYCDKEARMYKLAVGFHWGCSIAAGMLASLFICKLIIAPRVVFDELGSPTTAAPAGLLCMTLDIVFAGRGLVGQAVVSLASFVHLCLAVWFIYMALAYHIMPEPSWFPNTSSIGISAVKTWLYYPMAGHFLMAISLSLNFFFFPISLIRVAMNRKISATVGWMQMSAPNVSLYALTLMAQPSFEEEHPDVTKFQVVHRLVYLPCMHVLFGLSVLGMCASLHSLFVRWKEFRKLPFSPAHAAFCVPTLSHANCIQAYRAAVNSFSDIPPGSPFKICLYTYWVIVLVGGTIVTLWIGTKFLSMLPEWTHIDTEGEIEPPAPSDTAMNSSNLISTGETLVQPFVSPAILQANETGALVLSRNLQGEQVYRRTRKVTALGFEPIMSELQMDIERDLLLDWVARNPPRRRHRTLSVPGIDFSAYGETDIGTGHTGVYGVNDPSATWSRRQRATTSSPYTLLGRKSTSQPRYR